MKIALIGYGKMGHEIEKIAISRNHTIHMIIDLANIEEISSHKFKECDVAIEFTNPSVVLSNIYSCFDVNIPVVTGTTGWHEHLETVKQKCIEADSTLFYASNYSVGVNLFFAINEFVAGIMNKFPEYEVTMKESHHIHKLDAPSGTAVSLADGITDNLSRKKSWTLENPNNDEIFIDVVRKGEITGTHDVLYNSEVDFINLTHHAKNRSGFALGAVLAAEFINGKKGVFTMKDLLHS